MVFLSSKIGGGASYFTPKYHKSTDKGERRNYHTNKGHRSSKKKEKSKKKKMNKKKKGKHYPLTVGALLLAANHMKVVPTDGLADMITAGMLN